MPWNGHTGLSRARLLFRQAGRSGPAARTRTGMSEDTRLSTVRVYLWFRHSGMVGLLGFEPRLIRF